MRQLARGHALANGLRHTPGLLTRGAGKDRSELFASKARGRSNA